MKLKDTCSLESYDQPRQHIKKQRHYFANKGPTGQGYGFSSGHLWMWELDCEEGWVWKNGVGLRLMWALYAEGNYGCLLPYCSFDWHWFNNYCCGLSIHVLLLYNTLWIQFISWNWPFESWPCLEFFSDKMPQDISWGQMSFKALSNLWLFRALQHLFYGFPAHSVVKESTLNAGNFQETWAGSLGWEDSLKK